MSVRALQLDFAQSARRGANGVVLLVAGAAAALAAVAFLDGLRDEAGMLESRAAKLERRARGLAPVSVQADPSVQQEIRRANEIIDQLVLPWDRLFRAVEGAASERVVLRGIAPDAKGGTVQISAETADAEAMFV